MKGGARSGFRSAFVFVEEFISADKSPLIFHLFVKGHKLGTLDSRFVF